VKFFFLIFIKGNQLEENYGLLRNYLSLLRVTLLSVLLTYLLHFMFFIQVFFICLFSPFFFKSPSLPFLLYSSVFWLFMPSLLYLCSVFFSAVPFYFRSLLPTSFTCLSRCNSEITTRNTTNTQKMPRLTRRFVSSVITSRLASGQWQSTFRPTLQWMLCLC
jgi:hypothetical protein